MIMEIIIIYGLILGILTLVLSGGFLFSIKESRDEVVLSLISENIKSNSEHFLGFKLTIKRRQFLKALFLDFSPCHK